MKKIMRRVTAFFLCAAMLLTTNFTTVCAAGTKPVKSTDAQSGPLRTAAAEAAVDDAEQAFAELAASKNLMALIYLTDAYDVKAEPDRESATAAVLYSGHTVYVKSVHISEAAVWYGVSFWLDGSEQQGYVEEQYLAYADEDWTNWRETYLLPALDELLFDMPYGAGTSGIMAYSVRSSADVDAFPAAYRSKLQTLKDAHPDWIFVPVKTGLDFDTAVSKEMGDKSWIQNTESNRKAGYVGESTGQGSWTYATKKGVSYYMDTLNYIDATHIFAFEQLAFNGSYHTESAIQKLLDSTFMKGKLPKDDENRTYANVFYTLGKERKLSPAHLASRVLQEQGQGTSDLISGKYKGYEGYYNYFNVGASGNTNKAVIESGLKYAKDKGWDTPYKSIQGGAATIGNNYILKGQDSLYLQKFNVAPGAANAIYTHQYMQNIQAPWMESASTRKTYSDAGSLNSAFVFKIPLFDNMPHEEPEPDPEPEPNPIIKVTLDQTSLVLRRIDTVDNGVASAVEGDLNKDSHPLECTVFLEDPERDSTEDTTITWKSSDRSVAVVDAKGVVTAVNEGTATITATASKSMAAEKPSASCEVRVIAPVEKIVPKCSVTFYDESGRNVLKTLEDLTAGSLIREADFPEVGAGEPSGENQFMGWYTQPGGAGERFAADRPVYEPETSLYPYFAAPERGFFVVPVGTQTYTGSAIKPEVTVYDAEVYVDGEKSREPLVLNKDYTVSYKNNTKVNTPDTSQPTITVKGKGNYTGTQTICFDILPVSLSRSDIRTENFMVKYTGKKIKGSPVVYCGTKKLTKGKDYTLTYPEEDEEGAYTEPDMYPVEITGIGGYTGTLSVKEIITKGVVTAKKSMSKAKASGIVSKAYTGNPEDVKQSFTVTWNDQILTESTDGVFGDYVTVYKNIGKVGTATVEIHGIGEFTGTLKKTFKITKADLPTLEEQGRITVEHLQACPYEKGKVVPQVSVTCTKPDGKRVTLVKNTDYTVTCKRNARVTTGEMMPEELPTVTIKGKGNFKGAVSRTFTITDGQFENTSKVSVEAKDVVFKNKAGAYKTTVSIKDRNGSLLKAGTDYAKAYEYIYDGTPIVLDVNGDTVYRAAGEAVDPADIPQPGTRICVRVKAMGVYAPSDGHEAVREAVYRIIAADIAKVRVTVEPKTYLSGLPVTLTGDDLTVTLNGIPLVCGTDYIIDETTYRNNIGKGTASVVIRGIDHAGEDGDTVLCGGSKTVKFKITGKMFVW